MGKESIPAQFVKVIFIPDKEYGLDTPPQELTIHKKSSEMSADMPNHYPPPPPMLARSDPANGCMISPLPSWDPQLSKAVNSKPVPATGPPA